MCVCVHIEHVENLPLVLLSPYALRSSDRHCSTSRRLDAICSVPPSLSLRTGITRCTTRADVRGSHPVVAKAIWIFNMEGALEEPKSSLCLHGNTYKTHGNNLR